MTSPPPSPPEVPRPREIIIAVNGIVDAQQMQSMVQMAMNHGIFNFLIHAGQEKLFHNYPQAHLYSFGLLSGAGVMLKEITSDSDVLDLDKGGHGRNDRFGAFFRVNRANIAAQEPRILQMGQSPIECLVVAAEDWTVIPFENIIARLSQHPGRPKLIADLGCQIDMIDTMFHTLEHGVDGVIITPATEADILQIKRQQPPNPALPLIVGEVQSVRLIPQGDRVCVDTSSLLLPGEGLLVGNTSKGFALVEAEVHPSEFVSPRPFRVNAGEVSEYVLDFQDAASGPKTRYLSELQAGDPISIVSRSGAARTVFISRLKIETRPLILLQIVVDDPKTGGKLAFPITLQNAETVRLVCPTSSEEEVEASMPVSTLQPGDQILCAMGPGATHFGMPIKENIIEK